MKESTGYKIRKKDAVFIGILACIAGLLLLWFFFGYRKAGMTIEITIDGKAYGTYQLSENQTIPIEIQGTIVNTLVIEKGKANMTSADCPDQICVNHVPVSHVGESIVCLPNRVVVNVVGDAEADLDAVVK